MWVTKLLISPVKIRIFCPKKSKFGPKMAFLFFLGQALPSHLVGGCGARAVSRKTPIYFMIELLCFVTGTNDSCDNDHSVPFVVFSSSQHGTHVIP